MYFEINVSLHGLHFFATAPRSITDGVKLLKVYNQLSEKFTKKEGFSITVIKREETGTIIDMSQMTGS